VEWDLVLCEGKCGYYLEKTANIRWESISRSHEPMSTSKLKVSKRTGLSATELHFVECLLANKLFSPTEAAKEAGYAKPSHAAQKLLKNPKIARLLEGRVKDRAIHYEAKAHELIEELSHIALSDPIDFCDPVTGKIILDDISAIPRNARRRIDGIKVRQQYDEDGNVISQQVELKLVPKVAAIELLMKHLGMLDRDGNPDGDKIAQINWEQMFQRRPTNPGITHDPIELEIANSGPRTVLESTARTVSSGLPKKRTGVVQKPAVAPKVHSLPPGKVSGTSNGG